MDPSEYAQRFQEELPLILAAKRGCPQAVEELAHLTLSLRRTLAFRFMHNNASLQEDAMQVGWLGTRKALEKWDPKKGVRFITWCRWHICWAMRDLKCRMEKSVARPQWLYRKLNQISQCQTEDLQELSDLMSCPVSQIAIIQSVRSGDVSLSPGDNGMDDALTISDRLVHQTTPSDELSRSELISLALHRTRNLSVRERFIVDARYGLTAGEPQTHGEIGTCLGLTRQRVEQIESEAITKIRSYFDQLEKAGKKTPEIQNSRHHRKRRNFCRRARKKGLES